MGSLHRLGQVKVVNYCVPPYTIMVSITLGKGLKRKFSFVNGLG